MNSAYNGYTGFDEDYNAPAAPKWLAKAVAKGQKIAGSDASGKRICLSNFGEHVDDRNVFEHDGFYFVRVAGDVAYFKNELRKQGFEVA